MASNVVCNVNLLTKTVTKMDMDIDYATAGASVVPPSPNLCVIVGGTSLCMSLLSKVIVPVDESPFTLCAIIYTSMDPISWVYCE